MPTTCPYRCDLFVTVDDMCTTCHAPTPQPAPRRTRVAALAAMVALTLATAAHAAPKHTAETGDVKSAKSAAAATKTELAKARAASKLAAHRLRLAKAKAAAVKAAARLAHEQAIEDCVYERTGPTDGITVADAMDICTAETE